MKFLFDLGGVFFDWNPKFFFEKIFSDPEELNFFLNEICSNEWNIKQDAGRTIKEAEEELIYKFPNYLKQINMYYLNHRNMIKGVYQESINTLRYLKKNKFQCFVLSNWSAETFQGMTEEYPFLKEFDGMIISGEVKFIKPDPKIYHIAIDYFNLIPNETVFIDDNLENIKAAQTLGFKTIHLKDPSIIRKKIETFIN